MSKKATKKNTMGKPTAAYYKAVKAGEKKYPSVKIMRDAPWDRDSTEVTIERDYCLEAMSGCEDIAFTVSNGAHWVLQTSPLNERIESETLGGPVLPDMVEQFCRDLERLAATVRAEWHVACRQQDELDIKAATEEYTGTERSAELLALARFRKQRDAANRKGR